MLLNLYVWKLEGVKGLMSASTLCRLLLLVNKKPKWDAAQKGHVLNFEVSDQ
jgi:hypothetical protein